MRIDAITDAVTRFDIAEQSATRGTQANKGAGKKTEAQPAVAAASPVIPEAPRIKPPNTLSIQVDERGNVLYSLKDAITGEVLRQIPSEEMLRVMRQVAAMQESEDAAERRAVNVET